MEEGKPIGRRIVLGLVGAGAVGVVAGARIQQGLTHALAPARGKSGGAGGLLPGGGFRYYSVTSTFPYEDPRDYRLTVDGLVDRPHRFTYEELRKLPRTRFTRTFHCVTGWTVPRVVWSGVALGDLLERVRPAGGATALRFFSFDGIYTESLTLSQARQAGTLVALEMYERPITRRHGGPVRMYIDSMYGYKGTKWLNRIEVTDRVVPGYWERRGYDVDGWVGHSNGYSS